MREDAAGMGTSRPGIDQFCGVVPDLATGCQITAEWNHGHKGGTILAELLFIVAFLLV
jgi:hypothetical protein